MRKSPKSAFFMICAIALLIFCCGLFGRREPAYAGHPLSYWLTAYCQAYPNGNTRAASDAINHIGTNALPYLLQSITHRKPNWVQTWLTDLRSTESGPGWQWISTCLTTKPEAHCADEAMFGFDALGSNALPAVPVLLQLAQREEPGWNELIAWKAVRAMSLIGSDALPALLSLVTNNNADGQFAAIRHLPLIGEKFKNAGKVDGLTPAIQILARMTCDPRAQCAAAAAEALGDFQLRPEICVPALIYAMRDTRSEVREKVAYALGEFPEQTRITTAILVRALGDTNADVRKAVAKSLFKIAPEAFLSAHAQ